MPNNLILDFVISGYLITAIILNEIKTTNNFLFKIFYEQRVRRILPLIFFVIIFSLPFSYFFLLPNSFIEYLKSIISSIFFFSNYYFYSSGSVYWAISSWLKPFLHTWSLSVEIQFYILFPIFLLLVVKLFKKIEFIIIIFIIKTFFFFSIKRRCLIILIICLRIICCWI